MRWLVPAAAWGLAFVAVPVLIHLLVKQQSRRLFFPTLRFLHSTPVSALRRRSISEWLLLSVRLLTVAAAAGALAGPVIITPARRAAWNQRVARAVVTVTPSIRGAVPAGAPAVAELARQEQASAAFSTVIASSATLADGLRDAAMWLDRQPPAAREIVVIGDIRRDTFTMRDVQAIPAFAGLRFTPTPALTAPGPMAWQAVAAGPDRRTSAFDLQVIPAAVTTSAVYTTSDRSIADLVHVEAAPSDQRRAEAVLAAVLAEGIVLPSQERRPLTVVFDGAQEPDELTQPPSQLWMRQALEQLPDLRGGERRGALVVRAGVAAADPHAVSIAARIVRTVLRSPDAIEPMPMAPADLAAWTRTPGVPPDSIRPTDEGDRRWLWGAVLALLGIETVLRRTPRASAVSDPSRAATDREARVA